jgi:hypothetical protein
MTVDELKSFLESLSTSCGHADVYECYLQIYWKLVGFFSMQGVRDPEECTAATLDVAGRKIAAGTPVPDVAKYCRGIARNIARETLRRERREATSFLKFIEDRPDGPDPAVTRIDEILRPCFELLCHEDQELLVDYCRILRGRARSDHRREMAARRNTTLLALRMQVTRLRKDLSDCVKKLSNSD